MNKIMKIKQIFKRHGLVFIDGAVAVEKESILSAVRGLCTANAAMAEGDCSVPLNIRQLLLFLAAKLEKAL